MAQQTQGAPSIVMNTGGSKQQVPLRDYLNIRIAPFLKKAMIQSLDVETDYPLQWLGECLINQSMLYEGNPDRTKIRERFIHNFDAPNSAPITSEPRAKVEPSSELQTNGTVNLNPEKSPSYSNGAMETMEEDPKETQAAAPSAEDTEMAETT